MVAAPHENDNPLMIDPIQVCLIKYMKNHRKSSKVNENQSESMKIIETYEHVRNSMEIC